jgi:hypothetical protein
MRLALGQEFRTAATYRVLGGGRVEGVSFDGGGGVAEGLGQDRDGRDLGQPACPGGVRSLGGQIIQFGRTRPVS